MFKGPEDFDSAVGGLLPEEVMGGINVTPEADRDLEAGYTEPGSSDEEPEELNFDDE